MIEEMIQAFANRLNNFKPTGVKTSNRDMEYLNAINAYRKENNLPEFKFNQVLYDTARKRAEHLYKNKVFTHDGWQDSLPKEGFKVYGENLAKFKGKYDVMDAWKKSKTHNDNLLGDFSDCGVLTYPDGNGGSYTVLILGKQ